MGDCCVRWHIWVDSSYVRMIFIGGGIICYNAGIDGGVLCVIYMNGGILCYDIIYGETLF